MQVTVSAKLAKPTNATKSKYDCHMSHDRIWQYDMVNSYPAAGEGTAYPSVNQEGKDSDPCLINASSCAESAS